MVNSLLIHLHGSSNNPVAEIACAQPTAHILDGHEARFGHGCAHAVDVQARDAGIDFVKGVLVLLMIAFHAGSLFISDKETELLLNATLLDFVSGAWVYISGFLIILRYGGRWQTDKVDIRRRLWVRGAKLLAVFIVLNIIILTLGLPSKRAASYSLSTIAEIILYGGGDLVSFEVLLGIGYTILLGPVFFLLGPTGPLVVIVFVIAETLADGMNLIAPPNLWMITCGFSGMAVGYWCRNGFLAKLSTRSSLRQACLVYAMTGTALYYFLAAHYSFSRGTIVLYLAGVTSILALLYILYHWILSDTHFEWGVRLLGSYSLPCYIWQMGILWLLWYLVTYWSLPKSFMAALVVTSLILMGCVVLFDQWLKGNESLRKLYGYVLR